MPPAGRLPLGLLLIAVLVAACQQWGGAPDNGLVQVANEGTVEGSFHWQSPGLFGTPLLGESGTEPVRPCELYARGFAPGTQDITVSIGGTPKSWVLDAPGSGQVVLFIVIGRDGTISEVPADQAPASPFCG